MANVQIKSVPITSLSNGGGTVTVGSDGSIAVTPAAAQVISMAGTTKMQADIEDPDTFIQKAVLGFNFMVGASGDEVSILTAGPGGIGLTGTITAGSAVLTPPSTTGTLALLSDVTSAVTGLWNQKGSTDCSGNPNYPAASKGWTYIVSMSGKIGGASGTAMDVGDVYYALADNAGGTEASVGTSWGHIEHNLPTLGSMSTQAASAVSITGGTVGGLTSFGVRSTGAGFDLKLASTEVLTTTRTLTVTLGDAARTLTLSGSPSLSGITTTGTGTLSLSTFTLTADTTGTVVVQGGALGTPASGSGANLTALNASNLASGTVADARLPATVANIISMTALATVTGAASITGAASTSLTLNGGSNGGALVIGQGTNGNTTLTLPGTGEFDVTGNSTAYKTLAVTNSANANAGGFYLTCAGSTGFGTAMGVATANIVMLEVDSSAGGYIGNRRNGLLSFATNDLVRFTLAADGSATFLGTLAVTGISTFTGDVSAVGNIATTTAGKTLSIKSGSNAKSGTFTLVAGVAAVTNTSITANSVIVVTLKTVNGTRAGLPDIVPTATTGFVATAVSTDLSVYNWAIVEVG